ncbi:MAG: hypothetical protein IPJ39_10655 [Saprospiraceae bacterium]|nr:hypothetical protein [Saprospiraceae bacterium]
MKQLLWLLVLITCVAQAQNVENPTNGIIILADDNNIDLVLKEYNRAFQTSEIEADQLSEGIWLLRSGDDKVLYAWCKVNRNIQSVSWNARVSNRVKPDDSRLSEQYYLDIIKAYDSWEVTTGGTDYSGNDIIIGVVDEGFDIAHEDLKITFITIQEKYHLIIWTMIPMVMWTTLTDGINAPNVASTMSKAMAPML